MSQEKREDRPNILVAFISSVLFFALFLILHIIILCIVSIVLYWILQIPIISYLVAWCIDMTDGDPNAFAMIASAGLAMCPVYLLMIKLHKHEPTLSLSGKLLGIYTIVFWLACFIINLIAKDFVWTNLVMAGFGFAMFSISKDKD